MYKSDIIKSHKNEAKFPLLTNYYTKTQVNSMMPILIGETEYAALVAAGTYLTGREYSVVPDEALE